MHNVNVNCVVRCIVEEIKSKKSKKDTHTHTERERERERERDKLEMLFFYSKITAN